MAAGKINSHVTLQNIPMEGYSGFDKPIEYIAIGKWR